jgi:hypothetical protein
MDERMLVKKSNVCVRIVASGLWLHQWETGVILCVGIGIDEHSLIIKARFQNRKMLQHLKLNKIKKIQY